MRIHRHALFLTTTLFLSFVNAPAGNAAWPIAMATDDSLPVIEVWIGGDGPWRFGIDSGAEGSTVSLALARRLGLPAIAVFDDFTMAGVARVPLVRLEGLRLGRGGPEVAGTTAGVIDLGRWTSRHDLDGVLGGDVLREFDYLIDFDRRRLTLGRGDLVIDEPAGRRVRLPLRFERDRPVVSWPRPSGAPLPLVLDTGSAALIVDRLEASAFTCRPRTERVMRLDTHAGSRPVTACTAAPLARRGGLEPLDVGDLQLVAVTWPSAPARQDRGLLPASAFRAVLVSRLHGTLTLWPR